jgi:hypothetical protein
MLTRMVHLALRPRSPALQPFIKSFHYHDGTFPFGLERILPNGQAHLMINLAEDEFRTYPGIRGNEPNPFWLRIAVSGNLAAATLRSIG